MGDLQLDTLRAELVAVRPWPWAPMATWIAKATPYIRTRYKDHVESFREVAEEPGWVMVPFVSSGGGRWGNEPRRDNFAEASAAEERGNSQVAENAKNRLLGFLDGLAAAADQADEPPPAIDVIVDILNRFPSVVGHLSQRRSGRAPLEIADEYDVQYLLGAALRFHFDDVRDEEWTPSYAGGCSRIDFVLKHERIAIETKMTRAGLDTRKVGEELAVDILKYGAHPDCEAIVCFVFDPQRRIRNPRGFERDLTQTTNGMKVVTLVRPN
jgi:hypothetical protein